MEEIKNLLKKRNNRIMLIILIIGVVFIALSGLDLSDEKKDTGGVCDYRDEEIRLSRILSQIEGAGEVSVMISYESTMEKDIAYDGQKERAVTSGGDVMVKREIYPRVKGVVIICDGGEIPAVRQKIKEAVIAVTGAGANRVCVYGKAG